MKLNIKIMIAAGLVFSGCTSNQLKNNQEIRKLVIENSQAGDTLPDWVHSAKVSWDDQDTYYLKSMHSIRGDQRVNGCFDLAKLGAKENLSNEILSTVKGEVVTATTGLSEEENEALTRSVITNYSNNIRGLRVNEQAYERYLINDTERIDCYILFSVKKTDFKRMKNAIYEQAKTATEEILKNRQKSFLTTEADKNIQTEEQ